MTTFASDAFTGVDGTLLTAHTPTVGGPWAVDALPAGGSAPTLNTNALLIHQAGFDETSVRLPSSSPQTDYRVTGVVKSQYTAHGSTDGELYVGGRMRTGGWNGYVFGWYRSGQLQLRKYRDVGAAQQFFAVASAAQAQPTDASHTYEIIFVTNGAGKTEITCKYDGAIVIDQWTDNGVTFEAQQLTGDAGAIQWAGSNFTTAAASPIYLDSLVVDSVPTGAQKLAVTRQAGGAIPATVFDVQPQVALKDYFGATVTGVADTITVSKLSGPGTITGTLAQAVNTGTGLASWTNLQASVAGPYVLLYTSATYGTVTSQAFNVVAATANFSAGFLGTALSDAAMALADGMIVEFRDGAQPASTAAATTGTLGATAVFDPKSSFSFGTQGVTTFNPPASVVAAASITPTYARCFKADHTTVLMDIACGPSSPFVMVTSAGMTAGQRVQVECLTLSDSTGTITHATTFFGEVAIGGTMDGPAEQLRASVDVTPPPVTGTSRTVGNSGRMYSDLQAAINACVGGDEIVIDAGYDYTPPGGAGLLLTPHAGASYVTIRAAVAPRAVGVRVSPAAMAAVSAPKIRMDNPNTCINATTGSSYWRFIGIEVLPAAASPPAQVFFPVTLSPNTGIGNQGFSYADIPHHIILDRMYIHGGPSTAIITAVFLNGDQTALINSYVSEVYSDSAESHGVGSYMAKGPIQINNNYIEGSGQSVLLGGAESNYLGVCLGDVECRYNTLSKPVAWRGVHNYIKTLFEAKAGKRVLFEGNTLVNNWEGSQGWYGSTITAKSTNQNGAIAPWVRCSDLRVINNKVSYAGGMINLHALPGSLPSLSNCTAMSRVTVRNNLGVHMADYPATASPVSPFSLVRAWAVSIDAGDRSALTDVLVQHNTYVCPSGNSDQAKAIQAGSQKFANQYLRMKIWDNVFAIRSINPVAGDAIGYVDEAIVQWFSGSGTSLARNVTSSSGFEPSGAPASTQGLNNKWLTNSTDGTFPELLFTNIAGEDYSLAPASPGHAYATDGADAGVNMTTLLAALAGGGGGGAADHLAISIQPAGAVSGVPLTTQPSGTVKDGTGATATGDASTVTASLIAESGSAIPIGTLTAVVVGGGWVFTNLGCFSAQGAVAHWHFADGSLTGVDSASFPIVPRLRGRRF